LWILVNWNSPLRSIRASAPSAAASKPKIQPAAATAPAQVVIGSLGSAMISSSAARTSRFADCLAASAA